MVMNGCGLYDAHRVRPHTTIHHVMEGTHDAPYHAVHRKHRREPTLVDLSITVGTLTILEGEWHSMMFMP